MSLLIIGSTFNWELTTVKSNHRTTLNNLTTEQFLALNWEAQKQVEQQPYSDDVDNVINDDCIPTDEEQNNTDSSPPDGSISIYHPKDKPAIIYYWVSGRRRGGQVNASTRVSTRVE